MRKVFIAAVVLLMALMGMSAAADTMATPEIVLSQCLGYWQSRDVEFSNGYIGFCIDQGKQGIPAGIRYYVYPANAAKRNVDPDKDAEIDQYLKSLFINYHNDIFSKYVDQDKNETYGGYYLNIHDGSSIGVMLDKLGWHYADDYGKDPSDISESLSSKAWALVNKNTLFVDTNEPNYGDHDPTLYTIDPNTKARFDFAVFSPVENPGYQEFFGYKITYYRDVNVIEGSDMTFDVRIHPYALPSSSPLVPYVWAGDDTIKDHTDGIYTVKADYKKHNGKQYTCTVTDENGSKADYVFNVKVTPADTTDPEFSAPQNDQDVLYTVDSQEGVSLSVSVSAASGNVTYQWYKKVGDSQTPVVSATSSTLTLNNLGSDDDGSVYVCRVTKESNGHTKESKSFTLRARAKVTSPSANVQVSYLDKDNVELEIAAIHATAYRWYEKAPGGDYAPIEGSTNNKLIIPGKNGYTYYCVATNLYDREGDASPVFSVELKDVVIVSPDAPVTMNCEAGKDDAVMEIQAENAVAYQWYQKAPGAAEYSVIEGQTASSYTISKTEIESKNGYQYYCKAINGSKSDNSPEFTLKRKPEDPPQDDPLAFVQATKSVIVPYKSGEDVTLEQTDGNVTEYAWFEQSDDNVPVRIEGATVYAIELPARTAQNDGDVYYCVVRTSNGEVECTQFTLKLLVEEEPDIQPVIISPTGNVDVISVVDEADVILQIEAENALEYQWYEKAPDAGDFSKIDDATGDSFTINKKKIAAKNGYQYFCRAINGSNHADSGVFTLRAAVPAVPPTEALPPEIIDPTSLTEMTFVPGETVTMSVMAKNADHYQWMVDKGTGTLEEIKGATESSYTTRKLGGEHDGWQYVCMASNENSDVVAYSAPFVLVAKIAPPMPETGDNSMLMLWLGMMFGAMAMLVIGKRAGMGRN